MKDIYYICYVKTIIHFFNITLCLVILLLPMQNIVAQDMGEMDCCKTEQSKDCCDSNSTTENNHKKECKDCCTTAHTCASCFVFVFKNTSTEVISEVKLKEKTQNFTYKTPFFESLEDSIWQPPKIA
mgnify:FL=1